MFAFTKKCPAAFLVAIAVLAAGFALMLLSGGEPTGRIHRVDESTLPLQPTHLPAAAMLVISAGALLLLLEGRSAREVVEKAEPSTSAEVPSSSHGGVACFVAVTVAYVAVLPFLRFAISSAACIAAMYWLLGIRDLRWLVVAPLCIVTLIWGVFQGLLAMPLP